VCIWRSKWMKDLRCFDLDFGLIGGWGTRVAMPQWEHLVDLNSTMSPLRTTWTNILKLSASNQSETLSKVYGVLTSFIVGCILIWFRLRVQKSVSIVVGGGTSVALAGEVMLMVVCPDRRRGDYEGFFLWRILTPKDSLCLRIWD